jgi:hypothetical protein
MAVAIAALVTVEMAVTATIVALGVVFTIAGMLHLAIPLFMLTLRVLVVQGARVARVAKAMLVMLAVTAAVAVTAVKAPIAGMGVA